MSCVRSVKTDVNWHGASSEFFLPQKGIRQGDPMSPYLFVLCIDKLSHLIVEQVTNGNWIGVKAGGNGPVISHLMFADDLLLFGQATWNQMRCVLQVLDTFCLLSGQEVNLSKTSNYFSRNVAVETRQLLVTMSGFKEVSVLGKYLGIPLIGRASKKADFYYIIEQVNQRLAGWKAKYLSQTGRVTLEKAVMGAILIYPMMASYIPRGVINELERLQRNLIWGDDEAHRKYHAINWNVVTMPKSHGGLGLRRLGNMNSACLMKLGWELRTNPKALWCQVLLGKYACQVGLNSQLTQRVTDSKLWKTLVDLDPILNKHEFWVMGNGHFVNAWSQNWLSYDICIADMGINIPTHLLNFCVSDLVDSSGRWNRSLLQDWLPDEVMAQFTALPPPMDSDVADERVWPGSLIGQFTVDWIASNINLELGTTTDLSWANGCHLLRTWRNKMTHDDNYKMPWQPWKCVIAETRDHKEAIVFQKMQNYKCSSLHMIYWLPLAPNWVKLNTDGSYSKECGLSGCGGLMRDHAGRWLGGFSKSLGLCNAYVVELWGVYEGLVLAKSTGITHLVLEVDASNINQNF